MKHFITPKGHYRLAIDENHVAAGSTEVPFAPGHPDQKWNGTDYDPLPVDHPNIVRQQKLDSLAIRQPGVTPVTRAEFNNLLDVLGF